jgi:hypothetical protein
MLIAIVQIPTTKPVMTFYDSHVVVDNEAGKVHSEGGD